MKKRIIVAISGATGSIFGIRLLENLKAAEDVETHLILSHWAEKNIEVETRYDVSYVHGLADVLYNNEDMGAKVSSGSFNVSGMIIAPCSMKTLAAVSCGYADSLISRCADVMLKEGRRLIIVPRETPLNSIHLENMLRLSRLGVMIVPPMPAFYNKPETIDDLINHFTGRMMDLLGVESNLTRRWDGM